MFCLKIFVILIFTNITSVLSTLPEDIKGENTNEHKELETQQNVLSNPDKVIPISSGNIGEKVIPDKTIIIKTTNKTDNVGETNETVVVKEQSVEIKEQDFGEQQKLPPYLKKNLLDSGALLRGIYVFIGLGLVTLVYFLLKSYRMRNNNQPPSIVRKYGVLTNRGDVEMLPLPLDDDDDDDTVFDLGDSSRNFSRL